MRRLANYNHWEKGVLLTIRLYLGVSCQAWLVGEIYLQCYSDQSPVEDLVHCICRSSFLVSILLQSERIRLSLSSSWPKQDAMKKPLPV